ncbi:MAG: hypothetical protein QXY79_01665 [Candidatus Methanomethylicia archaeon]
MPLYIKLKIIKLLLKNEKEKLLKSEFILKIAKKLESLKLFKLEFISTIVFSCLIKKAKNILYITIKEKVKIK